MKKWPFAVLLIVGATVLGATVFREPIGRAAQSTTATIIGPLDANGNVKVHEQEPRRCARRMRKSRSHNPSATAT